jgi:hypothetical protein
VRLGFDNNDSRWVMNEDGSVGQGEKKTRLMAHDLGLLGRTYDVRIAAATEITHPAPVGGVNIVRSRLKKRTTFSLHAGPTHAAGTTTSAVRGSHWQIDVTEVESLGELDSGTNGVGSSRSLEIEFEMYGDSVLDLVRTTNEPAAIQYINILATELRGLVTMLIPGETDHHAHVAMQVIDDSRNPVFTGQAKELVNLLRGVYGLQPSRKTEFVGCMPVNLCRSNLPHIQQNAYFVTEKSDGERYLLIVLEDRGECEAFLMNRRCELHRFPGGDAVGRALGKGTFLDGELVFNRSRRPLRQVFLVFDVLADAGKPCLQLPFRDRLNILNDSIMRRLAHTNTELPLVRKLFVPKLAIGELLRRLHNEDSGRIYRESEKRHHRTDGIILQPDAPYVMGTDYGLMKWKWADLRTVDLRVEFNNAAASPEQRIQLTCMGPQGESIDCSKRTLFEAFDRMRVLGDIRDSGPNNSRIVEVTYNPALGKWRYLHSRPDKAQPNSVYIVMAVLMEQAEGISLEELEYTLLANSSSELDYAEQLQKLSEQLIKSRRASSSVSTSGSSSSIK